jgi:hypothetical protein
MKPDSYLEAKRAEVREQQKPIAEWLNAVMAQKDWTATEWAREAKIGRDTVSRAIREDYRHVTSTTTLLKLAKAAKVPAPIHLGAGVPGVPASHILADIMGELLTRLVPERSWPEPVLQALGKALRHTLLELSEDQENPLDSTEAKKSARMAARMLLDEDSEPHNPQT